MHADDAGIIQGKVIDGHTGNALSNANVMLVGTERGAATDQKGEFVIEKVPPGAYDLKVTYIGYETSVKQIFVETGKKVSTQFSLREDFFQTQQIIVTGTRDERLMESVPVVTELITRAEIEEKGAEDLSEILEDRPGITIESGTSGEKFLYMNGVDSRRILFLVDNTPLSGKLNNRIQLNLIDSDQIEHIEIVKGPGSALYGNEAMGGVINIITRGYSKGMKINADARAGSNDLYSGHLAFSGGKESFGYALDIDHYQRGYNQGASEIVIKETISNSVSSKLRYQNKDLGTLEFSGEVRQDEQASKSESRGNLNDNESDVKKYHSSLHWKKDFNRYFNANILGFYTDNLRTYKSVTRNSAKPASIDTTTDVLMGLKSDFTYTLNHIITFDAGLDLLSNDYENERLSSEINRKQTGVFAQLEATFFKDFTVIMGGRYDKITDIDGHFSPRLSAMYTFNNGLKLRSSWGGGFRAPSFIELYSDFTMPIPGMPLKVIGNPDLKPEKSIGGNFGVEYLWNSFLLVNATVFQNEFDDIIVDEFYPAQFAYSYLNVEKATLRGVELQTRFYFLKNFTSTLSYNFTDVSQKDEDVAISRISPHTASLRISYGFFKNKLKISVRDQFFSERDIMVVTSHGGDYTKESKAAYNVLDMTVSYKLNNLLTLRVGATNATDYKDELYGPYIGREVFLGIQTTFQKE